MKLALVKTDQPEDPNQESAAENSKMTFLEHLDELRHRLVRILIYVGIGFLVAFGFHRQVYRFIAAPILPFLPDKQLVYTGVADPIIFDMKVCFVAAIFLTSPVILFEIWKFIAPGLYRQEKRYAIPFLLTLVLLFVGGGAFCYYFILPSAFGILLQWNPDLTALITIEKYLSFANMMVLSFAATFEMPVVTAFLSMFGLITAKFMLKKFKYAVLIIVIAAAIVSPTVDWISMLFWAVPMMALYIVSIGTAALFGRRRRAKGLA
jgi:sec-independent protein translocase protein TatC